MLTQLKSKLKRLRRRLTRNEEGQAITEYGAIIAFVAVLVALTFAFTSGGFSEAVSKCFSSVCKQLQDMTDQAASAS